MRRSGLRLIAVVAALVAPLLRPSTATAHHPPPPGGDSLVPGSRVALELAAAAFELESPGDWRAATLTVQGAFLERFALSASVPFAHVRFRDGTRATGAGDMELALGALVLGGDESVATLSARLGLEVPTGAPEAGLGDGHPSLSPQATFGLRPTAPLSLMASFGGHFGLAGDHGHAPDDTEPHLHGSVLAPHAGNELRAGLWAGAQHGQLYGRLGAELPFVVDGEELLGPLELEGQLGVLATESTRVSARLRGPIAGPERLRWRAGVAVEYAF